MEYLLWIIIRLKFAFAFNINDNAAKGTSSLSQGLIFHDQNEYVDGNSNGNNKNNKNNNTNATIALNTRTTNGMSRW